MDTEDLLQNKKVLALLLKTMIPEHQNETEKNIIRCIGDIKDNDFTGRGITFKGNFPDDEHNEKEHIKINITIDRELDPDEFVNTEMDAFTQAVGCGRYKQNMKAIYSILIDLDMDNNIISKYYTTKMEEIFAIGGGKDEISFAVFTVCLNSHPESTEADILHKMSSIFYNQNTDDAEEILKDKEA